MDFRSYIREQARGKRILEIGPSYNPIVPKSEGFQVTIVDHADEVALREKYTKFGVDVAKIEVVDIVTTNLRDVINMGYRFDLIVASHLIEHTTDIVEFLNCCDELLEDGLLALIVPDKRFCFDYFRPYSTSGQAIDAHVSRRQAHLGGLFDHYANFTRNANSIAWGSNETQELECLHTAGDASDVLQQALGSQQYFDAHEWVFTPSSFRLMMKDLEAAKMIKLRELFFHGQIGCEFMTILSRDGANSAKWERRDLLDAIELEQWSENHLFRERNASLAALKDQLVRTQSIMQAVRDESEALKRRINDLAAERGRLESTIAEIRHSTSWRITKLLRVLKSAMRAR